MKYILSIIFLGLGLAGLISGMMYQKYVNEIFLGMIAPLVVGIISIQISKNVFQKSPEKLTAALTKSFLIKMVSYALYFIVILSFYAFEPIPFVVSFTCFFILFYIIEAVFLQKLLQSKN
jgi:hypothetical protein